ncbi:MAG: tRNA (adenosine(37)-N6)-threonylcarbamoyltransferase complex ATPase subunit type 1 TsaE [Treponema sp.]|nr:tRNA (adenosine(37)-N6)-threonylcarbamoyltransferase complex ATPase subunit type 1 TsaE [Treponema sp.]MCL2130444.1 tRNA (adenosine(37)-N6)-threonylcarbamoyltransferase complex ATPase subunit type 1 TsaE [Treponema sp.]
MGLGKDLTKILKNGSIIALRGSIGAGKTCFAKGIAGGLKIKEEIISPTYTIISEYEGLLNEKPVIIFHIDAFRLKGSDDFLAIGGEEIIFGNGITIIEWSENIVDLIPKNAIFVDIEYIDENKRQICISQEYI